MPQLTSCARAAAPLRVFLIVLVVGAFAGCGQKGVATTSTNRASPSPGGRTRSYRVVAPVLYLTRVGRPIACLNFPQSLPPAGCGGVPVRGYDFRHVARRIPFSRMGWQTPPLRLTGTWDGHVWTVRTASPAATSGESQPAPPKGCDGARTTPASRALTRALSRDRGRINLLVAQPCRRTAWVLVAVADAATVSYIHRRFGGEVIVSGWLQSATN
jgi:hypothetical protein